MQPKNFDLCTSNIFGRYLIEASAGTGKTYSLEHLVLRFIVEAKVEVDRILIVTFTKAATAEIKERVRKVLQRMSKALTNGEALKDKSEAAMVEMWTKDGRDALGLINRALEAFDDASVQTIHSFCQKMLTEFNFTRAGAYDVTVSADTGLADVVIDEFLRTETAKLSPEDAQAVLNWGCFSTILSKLAEAGDTIDIKELPELAALKDTDVSIEEATEDNQTLTRAQLEVLARFVELAPKRLEALEKEAGVMSFSSLLVQMYRLVMTKPDLVEKIRHRFDAVLIDEFQDTDSIQYGIFKTLFLPENRQEGPKSVFFVGDPKQAIYGFRMAELSTYLKARQELLDADPESVLELKKNFRSTPALVATINEVFSGGAGSHFLNEDLAFTAAEYGSSAAPLVRRIGNVLYPIPTVSFWLHPGEKIDSDTARQLQADRLAQDIANLLVDGNVYIKRDTVVNGVHRKYRLLRPGDIALLVRKRTNVDIIIDALAARGIRAAVSGIGDVFQTPEALEVAAILSAMDDPLNRKLLNTARATRLWGRTMHEIRDMADTQGVADRQLLTECAKRFTVAGPSAALNFLQDSVQTAERLLSVNQGFSILENYAHIIELLQAQFARLKTLGAVVRWFESQIAAGSGGDEDRKLRSVIDDNVVKIETVHSSKGLEYPLVYIPWASDMTANNKDKSVFFQEDVEVNGDILKKALIFSTEKSVSDHQPTKDRDTEERVRLAYVAMTRASSRLVVSLTYADSNAKANLTNGYLQGMMAVRGFEQTGKDIAPLIEKRLQEIQSKVCSRDWSDTVNPDDFGEGLVLSEDFKRADAWVEVTGDVDTGHTQIQSGEAVELKALPAGSLYPDWARSSFTSIARGLGSGAHGIVDYEGQERVIETDEDVAGDLVFTPVVAEPEETQAGNNELRFFRGADVGDWLHKLFEARFNAKTQEEVDDVVNSIDRRLKRALFMQSKSEEEFAAVEKLVVNMLDSVVNSDVLPLTSDFSAFKFNDLTSENRTNEMPFLLSVKNRHLTTPVLLETLKKAGLELEGDAVTRLTGYLTGAIDMVMFAQGKYWVVDWKSNFIGNGAPEDYTQQAMQDEIDRKHYRLQYVIYLLALKRHLITVACIPEEEVWDHIAGAMYVFLRGVDADQTMDENGKRNGIFIDCPREAVDALDKLLEGN